MPWTEFSCAINCSQTERGARKVTSIVGGISLVNIRDGSCPITSSETGFGKGRTSSGSAPVTAESHTEAPRTRASRNVRMLEASQCIMFSKCGAEYDAAPGSIYPFAETDKERNAAARRAAGW